MPVNDARISSAVVSWPGDVRQTPNANRAIAIATTSSMYDGSARRSMYDGSARRSIWQWRTAHRARGEPLDCGSTRGGEWPHARGRMA